MLRPTESAIIFIQQLGRGLRKLMEKLRNCYRFYMGIMKTTI
jgi:superfamily II DNA or RNA helicase